MTAITRTLHPRPVILVAGLLAVVSVTASLSGILGDDPSLRLAGVGLAAGLGTLLVADLAGDRLLFAGGDAIRVTGVAGALLAVPAGLLTLTLTDGVPVERLAGADRVATAAAVSGEAFAAADTVVIVGATSAADAFAAAPLAASVDGPLLLAGAGSLPGAVADEIERLGATRAYLVGSAGAEPPADALRAAGVTEIVPLTGADRYATSASVVLRVRPDRVYVTSDWEDAVAAPVERGTALLATPSDHLPRRTIVALQRTLPSEVVVLGGADAVSDDVVTYLEALLPDSEVTRLVATDRWEQSLTTFRESGHPSAWPWIAAGDSWPDAVTAAVGAAGQSRPLLLVPSRGAAPSADTVRWLERNRSDLAEVTVVGGEAAVSSRLISDATG